MCRNQAYPEEIGKQQTYKIIKHQKNYLKVVCVKQANHFPLTALMAVLQHCKLDARTEWTTVSRRNRKHELWSQSEFSSCLCHYFCWVTLHKSLNLSVLQFSQRAVLWVRWNNIVKHLHKHLVFVNIVNTMKVLAVTITWSMYLQMDKTTCPFFIFIF